MNITVKRISGTAAALVLLALAVSSVFGQSGDETRGPQAPAPSETKPAVVLKAPLKQEANLPMVGVVEVTAGSHQATVSGYGEVTARYVLSLTTQVSGEISRLAPHFETGALFKKGEVMAYLDDTTYQQAVASAKAAVENARVALEEERLQGIRARQEWQRSGLGGEPSSELVLRTPYLEAAQAALDEAQAQLKSAQRDLTLTQIVAPFDAIVVSRDIQPGSYIQSGSTIALLYSVSEAEIAIPLSASQWRNLPDNNTLTTAPWPVEIEDMDGLHHWYGEVIRIEQHLDTATRQRAAIVQINQPLEQDIPLYFGTYVTAKIAGKTWSEVWQIPVSAISQKQEVWFVTAHQTLDKISPDILFQDQDYAYISPVNNMAQASIVARPLNSYLVGTKVSAAPQGAQ